MHNDSRPGRYYITKSGRVVRAMLSLYEGSSGIVSDFRVPDLTYQVIYRCMVRATRSLLRGM